MKNGGPVCLWLLLLPWVAAAMSSAAKGLVVIFGAVVGGFVGLKWQQRLIEDEQVSPIPAAAP